jgi:hypothetical protein
MLAHAADAPRYSQYEVLQKIRLLVPVTPLVITKMNGEFSEDEFKQGPNVYFTLPLEPAGAMLQLDTDNQRSCFGYAAQVYALETGDLDVTVKDLDDAGWLPYLNPALDPAARVEAGNSLSTIDLLAVGTPNWRTYCKSMVLLRWYADTAQEEQVLTQNPAFWINPLTGAPMVMGENVGDLELWAHKPDTYNGGFYRTHAEPGATEGIPGIRTPDLNDYAKYEYDRTRGGLDVSTIRTTEGQLRVATGDAQVPCSAPTEDR